MEVRSDVGSGLRITFPPITQYVPPSSVEVVKITDTLFEDFENPDRVYREWIFYSDGGYPNWWVQDNDVPICCNNMCFTGRDRGMRGKYSLAWAYCYGGVSMWSMAVAGRAFPANAGNYILTCRLSVIGRDMSYVINRFRIFLNGQQIYYVGIVRGTDIMETLNIPITLIDGMNMLEFMVEQWWLGVGFTLIYVDDVRIYKG